MNSKRLYLVLLGFYLSSSLGNSASGYFSTSTSGYSYVETGINLNGKKSLVFQVQSTEAAQIALVTTAGDYNNNMYEIIYDSGTPRAIVIRNATLSNNVGTVTRDAVLLNGSASLWLWISWANGTITSGTGNVVGANLLIFYPDNSRIADISTVAVSSYSGVSATWKIPTNQSADVDYYSPLSEIYEDDIIYDPTVCKDIVFPAPPGTSQAIDLEVILVGRTSFEFKVNDYKTFFEVSLLSPQNSYGIKYAPPEFRLLKNEQEQSYYSALYSKPPDDGSPGYFWISWKNGLVVFGFGQETGKGILLVYNEAQPMDIHNASASISGTLTVPFRYYIGVTKLQRNPGVDWINFRKHGSDMCASGAVVQSIATAKCSTLWCSQMCMEDKRCTAFCLRKPTLNRASCICELQAKPGTPSSSFYYQYEPGTSYWEIPV